MKSPLERQAIAVAVVAAVAATVIGLTLGEVAVSAADRCNASCQTQGKAMLVYSISLRGETSCECARGTP